MYTTRYSCVILVEFELSRYYLEKMLKCLVLWKSVHWEPSCSMRTDITKLSHFPKFCERAEKVVLIFLLLYTIVALFL